MRMFKVCAAGLIGLAIAGCWKHDTDGTAVTPDAVAGLRFINLVSDTSALTFRVTDVVNNAPNTIGATFRTGGNPYGVTTTLMPPYFGVDIGLRRIKVFMTSTVDTIANRVMLDTVVQFDVNQNYTFYLYGTARTGTVGKCCSFLVTKDSVPTIPAGQFAVRVINLAPTMAGVPTGFASPTVDVFVDTLGAAATPVGAATFSAVNFGEVRPYQFKTARPVAGAIPALNYRAAFAATTTTTPFLQADIPAGVVGTAVANPIAGELVTGTAVTILLSPRSTAGSQAPQTAAFTAPTALFLIDQQPLRTAP